MIWAHSDTLYNGIASIKQNCTKISAISSYALGDSYSTVSSKILSSIVVVSSDFALSITVNNDAVLTSPSKTDTSAIGSGNSTHFAFLDDINSKVLYVTEDTSATLVSPGGQYIFPVLTYTVKQPTA
jgi:hypothetical protein